MSTAELTEPTSMTQRAVNELSSFNTMIEKLKPYESLTVAKDGFKVVSESRKEVKRLRIAIEAKREELKKGALEYGRAVDGTAKQLREIVEHIEGKLIAEESAFEKAREEEKRKREEERQAKKQARINSIVSIGLSVDWNAVDLPEAEWLEWIAAEDRKYQDRLAIEAEELRLRAAEIEAQRIADQERIEAERAKLQAEREQMEAKIEAQRKVEQERQAEERRKMEEEREALRLQREEIRRREASELEQKCAEERKQREDAAKPELERLGVTLAAVRFAAEKSFEPSPWWAAEFRLMFDQFSLNMINFVREGEVE